jgi:hypothetical protein
MSREFEHSIEIPVNRDFAWEYWTNVANWMFDTSVETVALDGPFEAGANGVTKPRGLTPIQWKLVEVEAPSAALIEIPLPDAAARFRWSFEDAATSGVRITQRVTLEGARAADYEQAMAGLVGGIPQGMQKMAEVITKAAAERR